MMRKTVFLSFLILMLALGGCGKNGEDPKAAIDPLALNGDWSAVVTIEDYRLGPPPAENVKKANDEGCDLSNVDLDTYNAIKEGLEENLEKPIPAKLYVELDAEGKGFIVLYSTEDEYDLLDDYEKDNSTLSAVFDGRRLQCSVADDGYSIVVDAGVAKENDKLTLSGSFVYKADKKDDFRMTGKLSGEKKG